MAEGVRRAGDGLGRSLPILVLPNSEIEREAEERGLRAVREVFADRGYRPDGALVPRREDGAVLHDREEIAARVVRMVTEGRVRAVDGTDVEVRAESVCVHGDTPGAVEIAQAVREALDDAGVAVRPF